MQKHNEMKFAPIRKKRSPLGGSIISRELADRLCDVNILMCVDPGFAGTGVAVFQLHRDKPRDMAFMAAETIRGSSRSMEFADRFRNYHQVFSELQHTYQPCLTVIEMPEVWSGSEVSVVASKRGDLLKLATLVGVYAGVVVGRGGHLSLPSPQEWKGNLPKEVTWARAQDVLGAKIDSRATSEHACDAIAMGVSVMGLL